MAKTMCSDIDIRGTSYNSIIFIIQNNYNKDVQIFPNSHKEEKSFVRNINDVSDVISTSEQKSSKKSSESMNNA